MYVEGSLIVEGALDAVEVFTDDDAADVWALEELAAIGGEYPGTAAEVFLLVHEHEQDQDDCSCIQYLTDHRATYRLDKDGRII